MTSRSLFFALCLMLCSNIAGAQAWRYISPMKAARAQHQAVLLKNGQILAIGGEDGHEVLRSCELYDQSTDTWREVDSMHERRHRFSAFVLPDGRVFVAGGLNVLGTNPPCTTSPTCEIYDPEKNTWNYTASLSQPRETQEACIAGNRIAIFAGLNANDGSYPNTGDVFDITTERMGQVPPLPASAAMGAMQYSPITNSIYVMGGNQSGYGGFKSKTTQKFSLDTWKWTLVDSMLDRQGALFNTVVYPKTAEIYAFTNDTAYNLKLTSRVAALDPRTGHWRDAGVITPRSDPHATLIEDSVILIGGIDATGSGMKSTSWYNFATGQSHEGPELLEPILANISIYAPDAVISNDCSHARNIYVIGGKSNGYPYQNSQYAINRCEVLTLSTAATLNGSLPHRSIVSSYYNRPADVPLLVDVDASLRIDSLWQFVSDISASYLWDSSVVQYGGYQPPIGWVTSSLNATANSVTFGIHKIAGTDTVPLNLGTASFYPVIKVQTMSQIRLLDVVLKTPSKSISLCVRTDEGHEWWVKTLGEAGAELLAETPKDILLYPNPASILLHFSASSRVTVSDALGRTYDVPRQGETLDVSSLPAGAYYICADSKRVKFVKE